MLPSPLSAVKPYLHGSPQQIALLLPLTGLLSGPGAAIREGFMAAANHAGTRAKIQVYDTASEEISCFVSTCSD